LMSLGNLTSASMNSLLAHLCIILSLEVFKGLYFVYSPMVFSSYLHHDFFHSSCWILWL
jgi:hypothetical protein